MKPAVVKTERQYRDYMARIEELAMLDPAPNSPEGEELELFATLVEAYEEKTFPVAKPDPVDAVLFRMHEQDLRQSDLVPYFGSRSRVSEFLSRQRPLTVPIVRELSAGLGIPAEVLIQDSVAPKTQADADAGEALDWSKFPINEMCSRGWIQASKRRADVSQRLEAVQSFIERALGGMQPGVLARRTIKGDAFNWQAFYALTAWQARVLQKAHENAFRAHERFELKALDEPFFDRLVRLSRDPNGPAKALDMLRGVGIAVVIENHLPRTKLDGAAMLSPSGDPVIALTLRFDRLDNFWFTLLHECVHVWRHLSNPGDVFLDRIADKESNEQVEKEANRFARDLLIPRAQWRTTSVRQMPTKAGILAFAEELGIHPSIVAGRIQNETENYAVFTDMVGRGEVSKIFNVS
ncbi:ImmA/IrrE family metallo-endopeptidase [Aquincola tertiaricarbonis]|uniref:ImmA/IrrE family metallo-endopeptidase n=1 Tax=Aquincola tertiaricarbonis TaxID=391953 RepID=A0ABY4SB77_AQUTE|nr:ImmA/IrrE family metallo-endopeptidase [Aquincola tertiaricarbonis]URI09420.1 ImmA/IrrE family metallo-endopeptidase [Aquincola tertiaricarbonis]